MNEIAKQLNIFVQEVPTTTNTFGAKIKGISKGKYLNGAQNAREQILKLLTHKMFLKWAANFITGSKSYIMAL